MDLRQLRYFAALAEELHFGRAAERLGITQPPLSQALQALERELGVVLLARTRRSVALTPVGADWLPYVRSLLAEAAALPEIAGRLARGATGSLRIAFVSLADYSVLPELVARYRAERPDVQLSLREATTDVQIEALLNGELDAGLIVGPASALHVALAYRPLRRETLVLAVPEAWIVSGRLPDDDPLGLERALEEPLVVFPRRSAPAFHDAITGYYAIHGARPRIVQEAIQMQTVVSLVSGGLGIALVPESLRNLGRAGVRYVRLPADAPQIEIGLAWRHDADSPALQGFVQLAR